MAFERRRHLDGPIAERNRDVSVTDADLADGGDGSAWNLHPLRLKLRIDLAHHCLEGRSFRRNVCHEPAYSRLLDVGIETF
ncbi:hypothetical protein ASE77_17045 [Sphingomonas sp. Leaf226]|nr:hypothetical protein ASE77_17045 [Sphingomonas sp. Leaf226]